MMPQGWPSQNSCWWRRQHNSIIEKITVLDAIYSVSWGWSSVNLGMLVRLWRKCLPDLEDGLWQGSPKEQNSKPEILNMVLWEVLRTSTRITLKNCYSDMCELRFQHMTDRHCQCCCKTERRRRRSGEWQWNLYSCEEESKGFTNTSDHYKLFIKINVSCVKSVKQFANFCECTKQNILDYPCFSIIHMSHPLH
jgi:hypothetical protein